MASFYIIYGGIILTVLILAGPTLIEDYRKERARKKS